MITFTKNNDVKQIRANDARAEILKAAGWEDVGAEKPATERELLIARANELELEFAGNISSAKLKELIAEAASA